MKTSAPFPWRDFIRRVAIIAVPIALQNLLTTTGSMVDTMMIASLGNTQVGAVGLCAQFSSLMFCTPTSPPYRRWAWNTCASPAFPIR